MRITSYTLFLLLACCSQKTQVQQAVAVDTLPTGQVVHIPISIPESYTSVLSPLPDGLLYELTISNRAARKMVNKSRTTILINSRNKGSAVDNQGPVEVDKKEKVVNPSTENITGNKVESNTPEQGIGISFSWWVWLLIIVIIIGGIIAAIKLL